MNKALGFYPSNAGLIPAEGTFQLTGSISEVDYSAWNLLLNNNCFGTL